MTVQTLAGNTDMRGLPHAAATLAYAGALPPIAAAILAFARPEFYAGAVSVFLGLYGGALIAFFGGVRWGIAVMGREGPSFRSLFGGALPLVAALPILAAPDPRMQMGMVAVLLPLLLWGDLRATRRGSGAPEWYLGVRAPLTILLEAAYLAALYAVLRV